MKDYYDITTNPQPDPQVKLYQLRLNSIREFYHHSWCYLDPDGKYGPKTKNVVEAFQRNYGLTPASGKLGPTTMKKIVEIDSQRFLTYSTVSANPTKGGIIPTELFQIQAEEIVSYIASFIKDVSDNATKAAAKVLTNGEIKSSDIEQLVKSMIKKPDVKTMSKTIEDDLRKKAHGNTNAANYSKNKQTMHSLQETKDAQKLFDRHGKLNFQGKQVINKAIYKQVSEQSVKELERLNIGKRISDGLKSPGAGGRILSVIALVPLIKHLIELGWHAYHNEPIRETVILVVKDIISFVVGTLIGIIIGAAVAFVGITGGVAVIVVIVIGIVIGILLAIFFPNWEENAATTLVNWIKTTADELKQAAEYASQYHGPTYCSVPTSPTWTAPALPSYIDNLPYLRK